MKQVNRKFLEEQVKKALNEFGPAASAGRPHYSGKSIRIPREKSGKSKWGPVWDQIHPRELFFGMDASRKQLKDAWSDSYNYGYGPNRHVMKAINETENLGNFEAFAFKFMKMAAPRGGEINLTYNLEIFNPYYKIIQKHAKKLQGTWKQSKLHAAWKLDREYHRRTTEIIKECIQKDIFDGLFKKHGITDENLDLSKTWGVMWDKLDFTKGIESPRIRTAFSPSDRLCEQWASSLLRMPAVEVVDAEAFLDNCICECVYVLKRGNANPTKEPITRMHDFAYAIASSNIPAMVQATAVAEYSRSIKWNDLIVSFLDVALSTIGTATLIVSAGTSKVITRLGLSTMRSLVARNATREALALQMKRSYLKRAARMRITVANPLFGGGVKGGILYFVSGLIPAFSKISQELGVRLLRLKGFHDTYWELWETGKFISPGTSGEFAGNYIKDLYRRAKKFITGDEKEFQASKAADEKKKKEYVLSDQQKKGMLRALLDGEAQVNAMPLGGSIMSIWSEIYDALIEYHYKYIEVAGVAPISNEILKEGQGIKEKQLKKIKEAYLKGDKALATAFMKQVLILRKTIDEEIEKLKKQKSQIKAAGDKIDQANADLVKKQNSLPEAMDLLEEVPASAQEASFRYDSAKGIRRRFGPKADNPQQRKEAPKPFGSNEMTSDEIYDQIVNSFPEDPETVKEDIGAALANAHPVNIGYKDALEYAKGNKEFSPEKTIETIKKIKKFAKSKGKQVRFTPIAALTDVPKGVDADKFKDFAKQVNTELQKKDDSKMLAPDSSKTPAEKKVDAKQLAKDKIIIIGDSNSGRLANKWYGKGRQSTLKDKDYQKEEHGNRAKALNWLQSNGKVVAPSIGNGATWDAFKATKRFFELKGENYKPTIAIIHMGYNFNASPKTFKFYKKTVDFLRNDKKIKDIRVIELKVNAKKLPKMDASVQKLNAQLKTIPGIKFIYNPATKFSSDGFHFSRDGYEQIYNAAMSGVSSAAASPTIKPVVSAPTTGQQQVKVRNRRATEMISDVSKFLKRKLTTSETNNLNKIYETAIQQLSYIDSKEAWDAIRYAYGYKESRNTYQPNKFKDRYKKIRFTGRYQIGPSPYRIARRIVSKYGITMPNFPYINSLKWSPGSQDIYFNDPIAQEASFLGFVLNNKNKVTNEAEDSKDLMALPGIAHNVGAKSMRRWASYRKQYRSTKNVQYLYKMWSLQDGNGTPGENFMRILLRQAGYKAPDLPMGFYWGGGSKKNDYKQLEKIKQFDPDLGNFIEKNYFKNWKYDARIFAFSEGNYAEKLWNWVTTSGQNRSSRINAKLSKNIEDYYNEYGDPIGSPVSSTGQVATASPSPTEPISPTAIAAGPEAAAAVAAAAAAAAPAAPAPAAPASPAAPAPAAPAPAAAPVAAAPAPAAAPVAASPAAVAAVAAAAPVATADPAAADQQQAQQVQKPDDQEKDKVVTSKQALRKFNDRLDRISKVENFEELIKRFRILYGTSLGDVTGKLIQLEKYVSNLEQGDLSPHRKAKFRELIGNVHNTNRQKLFALYKSEREKNLDAANSLMAFIHRPRLITYIQTNYLLYTNIDGFNLSFEMGAPFGNKVGVGLNEYDFFANANFGNSKEKATLRRILIQNKETFEALYNKLESFEIGQIETDKLTEKQKEYYSRFLSSFITLFDSGISSLEDRGSSLRRSWKMDNLAAAIYLLS